MSAAPAGNDQRRPWFIRRAADVTTPPPLPVPTSVTVRVVHAAYSAVKPEIQADMRAGRNSRRVGIAFDQLDARQLVPLRLSRRERGQAIEALVRLEAKHGGVLL